MAASVVCRSCGAKLKEGRTRCLRCGELLTAPQQDSSASPVDAQTSPSRPSGRLLIGGAVISLTLLCALAGYFVSQAPTPVVESAVQTSSTAPRSAAAPVASSPAARQEPVAGERLFMDSGRAGNASYARGDMDGALEQYQKAVHDNPQDVMSLNNLGQVLVRSGRAKEAIPNFERAIELNRSSWAPHFNLARAHSELGNWKDAIAEYQTAGQLFPDDYATQYNLARALHKSGQEDAAVTAYQRAIKLAPSEPTFRLSLGVSYEQLKRPMDAAAAYEQYLELAPNAADAAQVKSRIQTLRTPPPQG
jgi:Flp pilus assembly protein TadD